MSVTFQEPPRASASSAPFAPARAVVEQLRRFVQLESQPSSTHSNAHGASLSDVGFLLLRLKDQLLATDQRSSFFCNEFATRPLNGLELLIKVVVTLQNIVNSASNSSKISNLLTRTNSSTNRKRKAAVAEADCIECIKILLERAPSAWRALLENPQNLEVVLFSVNSPQLDSKCYALEIILLLLEQPQGFITLFRSLSYISARNRDYLRLGIFVSQLRHGLHTSKLHIQILVVRLLNKLLSQAPTPNHRMLAQIEATLAQFSPEYVEKMVLDVNTPLGGIETLMEELAIWRSLFTPLRHDVLNVSTSSAAAAGVASSAIYGYACSEAETDTSKRRSRNAPKYPTGQTTVVKNVERQRLKRQGDLQGGSGGRAASSFYPPDRSSFTLAKNWEPNGGYPLKRTERDEYIDRRMEFSGGGMRRAKSESHLIEASEPSQERVTTLRRGLKRVDNFSPQPALQPQSEYHTLETASNRPFAHSVHDLTIVREDVNARERDIPTAPPTRPASVAHSTRSLQRSGALSPVRARFETPDPERQRVMENIETLKQQPHAGFSYLFPSQPVLASVTKRAQTPEPFSSRVPSGQSGVTSVQPPFVRPPSAPIFDSAISPASTGTGYNSSQRSDGQVVYIPINVEGTNERRTPQRGAMRALDRRREEELMLESRSSSRSRMRSPGSMTGTIGEDVRDALSQFDYLNDYDAASLMRQRGLDRFERSREPPHSTGSHTTTYHF